jgi:hypothetical protein
MRKLRRYPTPPRERIGLSLLEVRGLTGLGLNSIRSAINAGPRTSSAGASSSGAMTSTNS